MMNDFDAKIKEIFPEGLQSRGIDTLRVNIGRYCNTACTPYADQSDGAFGVTCK